MRQFLWDEQEGVKVDNLVAQNLVVKSNARGGLMKKKNIDLLGKWLWRFPLEQNSLWGIARHKNYMFYATLNSLIFDFICV